MRHNQVILTGYVEKEAENDVNSGVCRTEICTVRAKKKSVDTKGAAAFEYVAVRSADGTMSGKMAEWKPGDVVQIKGVVYTENTESVAVCPFCGTSETVRGQSAYVVPVFSQVLRSCDGDTEQAKDCVRQFREVSNLVTLIGMACREPFSYRFETGTLASYQVAVRRKYRISADDREVRTDFPWVKSFGKNAERDLLSIRKGSYLFVDGYLRSRHFERKVKCTSCGSQYLFKDCTQEIIPYSVEYLKECRNADQLPASEKKRILGHSENEIYGENGLEKMYTDRADVTGNDEEIKNVLDADEVLDISDNPWDFFFEE